MRFMALDTATKTGYALRHPAGVFSGVAQFPVRRGSSPAFRFCEFRCWLLRVVDEWKPDALIYEQAHHQGGAATEFLVGLTTRVQEVAAEKGLEYRGVHSNTLKLWAAGHGKADKKLLLPVAKRLFPEVQIIDDNHADALLLLGYSEAGFPDAKAERDAAEYAAKDRERAAAQLARLNEDLEITARLLHRGVTSRLTGAVVMELTAATGLSQGRIRAAWKAHLSTGPGAGQGVADGG